MKEYWIPLEKRILMLTVLGLPFLFQETTLLALFLPLAFWMIWGDWRVIRVNHRKLCFRKGWFGGWREVEWEEIDQALWVALDRARLKIKKGASPMVSFGGLSEADCREVAGWIQRYSPCGLRRVKDELPRAFS